MGKDRITAKICIDGDTKRMHGHGIVMMMDVGNGIAILGGGRMDPRMMAIALIKAAMADGEDDIDTGALKDLVTQIMILGCQEQELVDNASFTLETMRMMRDVLGGGDE